MRLDDAEWWKKGIIYQVYPRSFQDSNSDGVGDLNGIIRRLDYVSWLGVDAIWISPIYPSPMADFGYDISDYCGIDEVFGTLPDFDRLLSEAHSRTLKVILDFVPNHTSDRHPWFVESRSSKSSNKRDWYIWRDPGPGGGPPNSWVSQFGGPAWTFDPATGQYYLHSFLREQPDLNWRNADVRKALFDAMRFWLDRGVDGFRVDVLWLLIKDDEFRDNPANPAYRPGQPDINRTISVFNADRPEIHEVVAQMRAVLDRYEDRVLIGEIYLPLDRLVTYYGKDLSGAQLPFNFALIHSAWTAKAVAKLVSEYEQALPVAGWPNWVLGNHDQPRIAARVGPCQARVAAMLLLTLRGTPTMYYGDEIGLPRVDVPFERAQDPWEKNEPGLGVGRDPWRTPMQWDASANAGFSTSQPWLPLDPEYQSRNVATLGNDPRSILTLYRRLIEIRQHHPALSIGDALVVSSEHDVLVLERRCADERLAILLNFGRQNQPLSAFVSEQATTLLSTHLDRAAATEYRDLRANEGLILLLPPRIRTRSA
jgi:alpha-glucosidase